MQIGLGRFSSYVVDFDALMREVERQQAERYTQTARRPCTVRLNPLDLKAIKMGFEASLGHSAAAPQRMFDMLVVRDAQQQLGAITITQCQTSLYQPGQCDCPQTAESVNLT